jgi:hypothetical protein
VRNCARGNDPTICQSRSIDREYASGRTGVGDGRDGCCRLTNSALGSPVGWWVYPQPPGNARSPKLVARKNFEPRSWSSMQGQTLLELSALSLGIKCLSCFSPTSVSIGTGFVSYLSPRSCYDGIVHHLARFHGTTSAPFVGLAILLKPTIGPPPTVATSRALCNPCVLRLTSDSASPRALLRPRNHGNLKICRPFRHPGPPRYLATHTAYLWTL